MTTLILARHGETDWNRENRFQGHADPPLNARGREQSRALARALAGEPVVRVYSSPLRRALETAELVAGELGVPVEALDALREVDVGSWSGLTRTDIEQRYPEAYARWLDYGPGWEGGETYEAMGERVVAALRELAKRHGDDGLILVVTHGGPLRAAQASAAGVDYAEARRREGVIDNCAVCRFAVRDGGLSRID